jgi:hypothetical protein
MILTDEYTPWFLVDFDNDIVIIGFHNNFFLLLLPLLLLVFLTLLSRRILPIPINKHIPTPPPELLHRIPSLLPPILLNLLLPQPLLLPSQRRLPKPANIQPTVQKLVDQFILLPSLPSEDAVTALKVLLVVLKHLLGH